MVHLIPRIQLDNYQLILNNLEIDLMTGRTNSITKDRREFTSKTVGNADIQFGREIDHGCCWGDGDNVTEKGERLVHREANRENVSP